jgi:hypothetical protein
MCNIQNRSLSRRSKHQLPIMSFQRIALAGATGYLGRKVLAHLLTIPTITKITILSRTPSIFPSSPILSSITVSYDDHDALTSALRGHDLLISTLAGTAAETIDPLLISASISASVKRFMPSEYTLDIMHPHAITIAGSTVLANKIRNAKAIHTLAEKGAIEYTTLVTGAILDWWFENGDLGVDIRGRKVVLYDGGEKKATGVTTDFIAECVGAVVRMSAEATKNRRIRIAEVEYDGRELLRVFEEVSGEKWDVEEKDTESLLEDGKKAGRRGDMRGFYVGHILRLNFDGEGAAFFEEGFKHGGEFVTRRTLKEIVKSAIKN